MTHKRNSANRSLASETSSAEAVVDDEALENADQNTQLELMRDWFYRHFEDPGERTPYESAEGGFIWIWGGPYDAYEELYNRFSEIVPDEVIDALGDELSSQCPEWARTPSSEDYDDYLIEQQAEITDFHGSFNSAICDIEKLLKSQIELSVSGCFYRLLFVNIITALETYLSDAFINTVVPNPDIMRQFIENTREFQNEKVVVADIFKAMDQIEKKARSYLAEIIWHRLDKVQPMYRDTLGIEFPKDIKKLFQSISKRHDIVHRNGKSRDGEEIVIKDNDVRDLMIEAQALVQDIDSKLAKLKTNSQRTTK